MSDLLNQASLVYIPSGYKEDTAYSVIPTDGSGDLTFTRASDGTRVNSQGLVERVPWNLVQQSESIGTIPWLTNGATLTSGQTDPSGGTTAVKVELASGGNNYVYQGITIPQGTNIVSAYLKADSSISVGFSMGGSTPNSVNLTTTWQLFTFSSADTSGGIIFDNYFGPSPTQEAKTFYLWHPQFNEGSTAKPYFPTTDRLNVPRLDYSGGCPSLLLEPQRTNLVTYSEQFDNAAWGKTSGASVTANDTISPDGTQNADKITFSAYGNNVNQIVGYGITGTYTHSFWAKGTAGQILNYYDGVGDTAITLTADWVRYTITKTYSSQTLTMDFNSYGSWSAGIVYLWGAQLEASSYPTSYIPTTSASVTRVADAAYKTGISSLIGQSEGTLFVDFVYDAANTANERLTISDGTSAKRIFMIINTSSLLSYTCTNAGSDQWNINTTLTVGQRYKIAGAYKSNDIVFYVNGVQIGTDTSASIPDCSNLYFANENGTTQEWNNRTNQLALFKTRLTNAELAALTTL